MIKSQETLLTVSYNLSELYKSYQSVIKNHEYVIKINKEKIKTHLRNFGLNTDDSSNLPWSEDFQINEEHFSKAFVDSV